MGEQGTAGLAVTGPTEQEPAVQEGEVLATAIKQELAKEQEEEEEMEVAKSKKKKKKKKKETDSEVMTPCVCGI